MIRKLLATTAFATLIASGAFAQTTTTQPATTAPAATQPADGAMMKQDGDHLATNIIGEAVYNGNGQDAERIGDVNDLVIGQDGKVASVIVGVGGFLGIGEKNVAMDYSQVKWNDPVASGTAADGSTTATTGDRWLVVNATKESLEAQPSFDRSVYDASPAATTAMNQDATGAMTTAPAANGSMATGGSAMAPATTDGSAMAPATTADNSTMNNNMAATQDSTQTAAIDRSTLTGVPADKLTAETLVGTTVYGANDSNVGEIRDIVLSQDGKVDAVLIDVGGFLGIGEKTVAIGMDKLSFMQDGNGNRYLYTTFTKDQLEAQTAYDANTYAAQRDTQRMNMQ